MTVEQIIRNFQLYLLTDIELDKPYLDIYSDLERMFSNLQMFKYVNNVIKVPQLCYGKDINNILFIHSQETPMNFIDSYPYKYLGNKYPIFGEMNHIISWYIEYKFGLKGECYENIAVKDYINNGLDRNHGKVINI